ncbi:MAG: mobile mystery protein A [Gammaproteobacteria bacterium]|nr:mobile mystery protein A [Gammaproteobacteria bacterium]
MRAQDRATARRQLDKRLNLLRKKELFARPPRGWIKAIRESLGMTTRQFARRIGIVQSRAVDIEKAEVKGSITLDSLERAARALDCELVYALVPRNPLETMVEERANRIAKRRLKQAAHSMALEDQSVAEEDKEEQAKELARQLAQRSGSALWEDEWPDR